jgi:hypothetical protein
MDLQTSLAIGSAFFYFLSALLWGKAALRKAPKIETHWDAMPEDSPFVIYVRTSSRENAIAAALSAFASILAGASVGLPAIQ